MKKMLLSLFLLSFFIEPTNLYAQGKDNPLLPVLTLPSPEAASLGKYGVWPVSQYTGIPNISVPVYQIEINGFKLPITLDYHAGGVKIDDKASWTGTNWSLSAGGMIGRTVVGLPDEDPLYGVANVFKFGSRLKSQYNLTTGTDYNTFLQFGKNSLDSESDMYYYNFCGNSGRLLADSNFDVRTIPASNLQFRHTPFSYLKPSPPSSDSEWEIADLNGNIYKFGMQLQGVELTNVKLSSGQVVSQGITALYLVQVILANKADTIHFYYDDKNEAYPLPYTQSCRGISLVRISEGDLPDSEIPGGSAPNSSPCGISYNQHHLCNQLLYNGATFNDTKRSYTYVIGNAKLRRITWRGGQVEFRSATFREDMLTATGTMLDSINVSDNAGNRIKSVKLDYNYVNGRYYLDSVKEIGNDMLGSPIKYAFGYNNRSLLPPSEPMSAGSSLNYNAQDHWGFYNAKSGNTNLLPANVDMPSYTSSLLTSNREPDTTAMQYGTLNRVTYPTGGYTNFIYEAHRYDPSASGGPQAPVITAYTTAAMNFQQPVGSSVDFDVPFNQNNVSISMNFNDYAHPPSKNSAVFQYVKLQKKNVLGVYQTIHYWDAFDNFPLGGVSANPRGYYDFNVSNNSLTLDAGNYRLIVNDSCPMYGGTPPPDCLEQNYPDPDPNDDIWIIPLVTATITYQTYDAVVPQLPIAGGLRIKEMANYTGGSELISRKQYQYIPGKLLMYPQYVRTYEYYKGIANDCHSYVRLKEVSNTSQTILGFTQGSSVGYTNVQERDVDAVGNDIGYTSYNFSFMQDSLNLQQIRSDYWQGELAESPAFPVNSFEYKRGYLLSKAIYKRSESSYLLIDSTANEYDFNDFNTSNHYYRQRNLRVKQLAFDNGDRTPLEASPLYPGTTPGVDWEFSYATYDHITTWVQLLSTKHIMYDQDGANPLTDLVKYYYDNPVHMLPSRTENTDSKGIKKILYSSYPQDYAAGTAFIDDLVAAHVIGKPVENITYQQDGSGNVAVLEGVVTIYKTGGKGIVDRMKILDKNEPVALSGFRFSNTSQGVLPFNTTTRNALLIDSRYADRVLIPGVNAFGNPTEQQKVNDVKEVYIWGYNGMYPVAKLVGTDYTIAQGYITQSILDNAKGGSDDAAVRTELNKLRNIPGALVTTYTYKPLVGVTSQTDQSGKSIFYEYDSFNRLKTVRDQDGKILKTLEYHYAQ